jgi:threonine dehydrogenase-like Zn-dependent dehydrogenase
LKFLVEKIKKNLNNKGNVNMKANIAFLHKPYDLRLEETEIQALKPNQLLVRVRACGICGSDISCFIGHSKEGRYDIAPYTPGHEWCGEVAEIGENVEGFAPGNKITGDCVMQCGVCENCKKGLMPTACKNMREGGFRPDSPGGMGEYLVIDQQFAHRIPDEWSFEEGAWVEPFSVGYFSLFGNGSYIDASDTVVIFGGGPIGITAAITAKALNAKTILVDPRPYRREMALNIGVDAVIDAKADDIADQIYNITNGAGATAIVEASGNERAIALSFDIAAHGGRISFVGHAHGKRILVDTNAIIWKTLTIKGAAGVKDFTDRTIRFMDMIRYKYDFTSLNTYTYPLERIHEAFDKATNEKAIIKVSLQIV